MLRLICFFMLHYQCDVCMCVFIFHQMFLYYLHGTLKLTCLEDFSYLCAPGLKSTTQWPMLLCLRLITMEHMYFAKNITVRSL